MDQLISYCRIETERFGKKIDKDKENQPRTLQKSFKSRQPELAVQERKGGRTSNLPVTIRVDLMIEWRPI